MKIFMYFLTVLTMTLPLSTFGKLTDGKVHHPKVKKQQLAAQFKCGDGVWREWCPEWGNQPREVNFDISMALFKCADGSFREWCPEWGHRPDNYDLQRMAALFKCPDGTWREWCPEWRQSQRAPYTKTALDFTGIGDRGVTNGPNGPMISDNDNNPR